MGPGTHFECISVPLNSACDVVNLLYCGSRWVSLSSSECDAVLSMSKGVASKMFPKDCQGFESEPRSLSGWFLVTCDSGHADQSNSQDCVQYDGSVGEKRTYG